MTLGADAFGFVHHRFPIGNKTIYGTAFNMSDADVDVARHRGPVERAAGPASGGKRHPPGTSQDRWRCDAEPGVTKT